MANTNPKIEPVGAQPGPQSGPQSGPVEASSGNASSLANAAAGYAAAVAMTGVATLVAIGLDGGMAIPNLSLVYVVPVIVAGVYFGLGASLCAAVLGALCFNFFFTEPRYTLMVDDPSNIWAIALLFLVGLIVSTIAFTARRRTAHVSTLNGQLLALQKFSNGISGVSDAEAAAAMTSEALATIFRAPSIVVVFGGDGVAVTKSAGGGRLQAGEMDAARAALEMDAASRANTFPSSDSRFDFWPARSAAGSAAVIGLALDADNRPEEQEELVDIVKSALLQALDRIRLAPV